MSLTLGSGPLASNTSGQFNFSLDGAPQHRLLFEDFSRRMRALVGSHTVLDSTRGKLLHESNIHAVYYAPVEDFDRDVLVETDHSTHCPFKGDASYWSVKTADREVENAVWYYPEPSDAAREIKGRVAFWKGVQVS